MPNGFKTYAVIVSALLLLVSCGGDDEPTSPPRSGQSPEIISVAWTQVINCQPNVRSSVNIVVTATDPDTDTNDLIYQGSVSSCTGVIAMANDSVSCPQAGVYSGTVTVRDPQSNADTMNFQFGPCQDGQVP